MKRIVRLIFTIILIAMLSGCNHSSRTMASSISSREPSSNALEKRNVHTPDNQFDELVNRFVDGKEFSASVLIAENGEVKLCKGYGMADYERNIPNTPDTKFYISSMTKPITAIAVMQLNEKGLLDIMDPVSKYLPECNELKGITISHLLTHSSGLPRNMAFDIITLSPEAISQALKGVSLEFKPGSRFNYSSTGYYILGLIIEKVSGKSYGDYVNENIFKPAGMKDSGCGSNVRALKNCAAGYSYYNNSLVQEKMDMGKLFSAGCIYSTVKDMYLLDRALYGEKLLKKETLDQMYTPLFDTDLENRSMGYGWFISYVGDDVFIEHGGLSDGYNSLISRRIKDKSVIIVLSNISNPQVGTKELVRFLYEGI